MRDVSEHVARALRLEPRAKPVLGLEAVERLAIDALASGADRTGSRKVHWDVSGPCIRPRPVVVWSRSPGLLKRRTKVNHMMEVTLLTPCRRCPECLQRRARLWRMRAIAETSAAERTWFGTLTASPEQQYRLETRARAVTPGIWEELSNEAKFHALATELGKDVTLWLKRLRKNRGMSYAQRLAYRREQERLGGPKVIPPVAFRYLITCEIHDSEKTSPEMRGRPHMHLLLHEFPGAPLKKQGLQEAWKLGHSSFKLVQGHRGAMYVAKYLSKASDVRVRASEDYGSTVETDDALLA